MTVNLNTIQLKSGSNEPPNGFLAINELGYSINQNQLYIGKKEGETVINIPIGVSGLTATIDLVESHLADDANPHNTTKAHVGLSNVDNHKQLPISGGVLENYREKLVTLSGTSTAINLSLGNLFTHSLTGNTTYSITNAVAGQAHSFTLIINMGSTVKTLTFPASVKWQGGEIPDMSTANKTYVLTFVTVDGGTNWLGMFGGEF